MGIRTPPPSILRFKGRARTSHAPLSLLLMTNYIAGVGVEAAGYARDRVGAGVVVPGASAAISRQSPKVKVLIRPLNGKGYRSEHKRTLRR